MGVGGEVGGEVGDKSQGALTKTWKRGEIPGAPMKSCYLSTQQVKFWGTSIIIIIIFKQI